MNRLGLALAGVIFSLAASSAHAGEDLPWYRAVTNQGCVLYWQYGVGPERFARETAFNWSGTPCEKGQPLNGKGTLTFRLIAGYLAKEDPTRRTILTGRVVDGVMDGPVRRKYVLLGKTHDEGIKRFKMGCNLDLEQYPPCISRERTPSLAASAANNGDQKNSGVAAQGTETQAPFSSGPGGSSVPPLRATATLEAHNPANEASDCLDLITKSNYERMGVSSTQGAVFRNRCPFPVEARWCIGSRCANGYDNLATMPAKDDRGISYDAQPGVTIQTKWAGCRQGFAYRPDFAGTLQYACK
ncbi:MAG: hypothetical protein V4444_02160 [Pseudomonadota bacterium]